RSTSICCTEASDMATKKSTAKKGELRIRMYRVGFGDFFLMTVPTDDGPQHILIDCGVTKGKAKKGEHAKGDIGTIKAAVAHMAAETGKKLALIIVTHRHEDHIIGFSRAAEIFNDFKVGAIWMSIWETEYDPDEKKEKKKSLASEFQEELTALALGMQSRLALAGKDDPETDEILAMLRNATGIDHAEFAAKGGAASAKKPGTGGGTNAKSLEFLKSGLGLEPQYYVKGDKPKLPKVLKDAGLTAQILGPPPTDAVDFMKLMDLKKGVGQYLGEAEDGQATTFDPLGASWHAEASDYPPSAFRELDRESKDAPSAVMEAAI